MKKHKNPILVMVCMVSLGFASAQQVGQSAMPNYNFSGQYLLSLSDADMVATGYVDNQLGEATPGVRDTLTVLPLPKNFFTQGLGSRENPVGTVNVSNCICNVADAMVLSKDGRTAYVIEKKTPPSANNPKFDQLPSGNTLRAVSLNDPLRPRIAQTLTVGTDPEMLSINPEGTLLALPTAQAGQRLQFIPVGRNASMGAVQSVVPPGVAADAFMSNIAWHPSGRFISINLPLNGEVRFFRVNVTSGGAVGLTAWGRPVTLGKFASSGYFTPDGRFFISNALQWGMDVEGFFINPPAGQLQSTRFVAEGDSSTVSHELVSSVTIGQNPETFRISPDGSFVISANLRGSGLLWNDSRMTMQSSLTMVSIDRQTGRLTAVKEYPFDGVLPQGLQFDADGKSLAVTLMDQFDLTRRAGSIEFWRVDRENKNLERTGFKATVARGVYQLALIR
jgi:DNA-binding beta-propeller fold protein YncE